MTDLRDRLRRSDPLESLPPLDAAEAAAIRRAMREAVPVRKPVPWKRAAGLALGTAAGLVVAAVLLLWPSLQAPPDPEIALAAAPAWIAPLPELPPAPPSVAQPTPRPDLPAAPVASQVREVRFVTTTGTQILWSFRPGEEGA
jgi:hypothetical protein